MFRPVQAKYRLWIWILAITADIQVEPAANIVYNKGQGTNRQKIYRLHLPHLPISAVNADRIQRSLKMGKSKKRHSRRHSKSNKAKVSNAAKRNNPANKAGVQEKTAEAGRPLIPDSTEQVSAGSPAAAASDKTFQAEKAGRDRFFAQKAAPAGRPFAAETADADRSPAQKAAPAGRPSAAETADADRSPAQKAATAGRPFSAETADANQAFVQEKADTPSRFRIRPLPILTTIAGIAVCFVVILYFNGRIAGNLPGSAVFTNLPVSYPQSAGTGITTNISEPNASRTIPGNNESIDTSDDRLIPPAIPPQGILIRPMCRQAGTARLTRKPKKSKTLTTIQLMSSKRPQNITTMMMKIHPMKMKRMRNMKRMKTTVRKTTRRKNTTRKSTG